MTAVVPMPLAAAIDRISILVEVTAASNCPAVYLVDRLDVVVHLHQFDLDAVAIGPAIENSGRVRVLPWHPANVDGPRQRETRFVRSANVHGGKRKKQASGEQADSIHVLSAPNGGMRSPSERKATGAAVTMQALCHRRFAATWCDAGTNALIAVRLPRVVHQSGALSNKSR